MARHIIFPSNDAENEQFAQSEEREYISPRRHVVTLRGDATLQYLREGSKLGGDDAKFATNSSKTSIEFFEGAGGRFQGRSITATPYPIRIYRSKITWFEKLIQVLNS